jgi:putative transposase
MICEVWGIARSTVYLAQDGANAEPRESVKRGPKTELSDEALVEAIREVIEESDFLGEGHRKVRVRLRPKGIWVGKNRGDQVLHEGRRLVLVLRGRRPRRE